MNSGNKEILLDESQIRLWKLAMNNNLENVKKSLLDYKDEVMHKDNDEYKLINIPDVVYLEGNFLLNYKI